MRQRAGATALETFPVLAILDRLRRGSHHFLNARISMVEGSRFVMICLPQGGRNSQERGHTACRGGDGENEVISHNELARRDGWPDGKAWGSFLYTKK